MMAKDENPELYKQLFSKKQSASPNKDINFTIEWSTGYIADIFKILYNTHS